MDPQYADVYYVDTRNAPIDHRTVVRPGGGNGRVINVHPTGPAQSGWGYGPPAYGPTPYGYPGQFPPGASWFSRLSTGGIIDMVAQIFAALMPLPAAPVATQVTSTDVGNSILYQQALAQYAKRDEQVRTLGSLVQKLVG